MKFSNLLGKNIISLAHAKELGIIYSCTVDNKLRRINQIATIDNDENEGYIQNKSVNFGKDVMYTVNALADYEQNGILFPFRARVFDTDGQFLGKASDFEFEKNQIIEIQLSKEISIKSSDVVIASKELIIVKGNRKIRACTSPTKRTKTPDLTSFTEIQTNTVETYKNAGNEPKMLELDTIEDYGQDFGETEVASDEIDTSTITETKEKPINKNKVHSEKITIKNTDNSVLQPDNVIEESPRTLISGYQFLLGRKVVKNILQGGMLIIPKDKTIDTDTVELARKFGKLVELTVSSIEK